MLRMEGVIIGGNKAGRNGGGVAIYTRTHLILSHASLITENKANLNGGGVFASGNSTFLVLSRRHERQFSRVQLQLNAFQVLS
jgi:hypothetical protein